MRYRSYSFEWSATRDRDDARREAERLAAIERQRIRQEAERLAEIQHAENVRAETLRNQHAAWREARQPREFLGVMTVTVDGMSPGDQRDAATEWLGTVPIDWL